jgi:hypothetical protein
MIQKPSYTIAIVGPPSEFAKPIETNLQEAIPNYDVIGYDSVERFIDAIDQYPLKVPFLVVADIWAREPSIREGVFTKAHEKVPRARGIYFSSQPVLEDCAEMVELGILAGIVRRSTEGDIERLGRLIAVLMESFKASMEYWLIDRLAEKLGQIPDADHHTVDTELGILPLPLVPVEFARKTAVGEVAVRSLLGRGAIEISEVAPIDAVGADRVLDPRLSPSHTKLLPFLRVAGTSFAGVCIFTGLVVLVTSLALGFFDIAVLGLGALLTGVVHVLAKE